MSDGKTTELIKMYLNQGIRDESENKPDKARENYEKALGLLKEEYQTIDPIKREMVKRQIISLETAISRMVKKSPEEKSPENDSIGLLKDLGLSLESGNGPGMDQVAGMKKVKEDLYTQIIYPLKFPDLAEEFNVSMGGGVLLYGPPGNGKTFLIKALAKEANMNFINVNPSSLFSQWFGNFEKNITSLFKAAKGLSPCILFFDELDSLFPPRDNSISEASKRGVSQFLNEIGGFSSKGSSDKVIILGATNVPWNLDPAVTRPGRFDRMIYIPPPDRDSRREIIRIYSRRIKRVKDVDIEKIANLTQGYSAADLEYLFRFSSQKAFLMAVEGNKMESIGTDFILENMKEIKPSVSKILVEKYEKFASNNVI